MNHPPASTLPTSSRQQGFTLLEISIVLVIIGLVIGAVMVGGDLIVSAHLRGQIKQIESYKSAINTFRIKYNCIPGDCPYATRFWPQKSNCGSSTAWATAVPNTSTCNGTGDRRVAKYTNMWTNVNDSYGREAVFFWQHLANAGLIDGQYTGYSAYNNGFYGYSPGDNIPKSYYPGGGVEYGSYQYAREYFIVGDVSTSGNAYDMGAPLFTAQEAYKIDKMIDNGKPGSGNVVSGIFQGWAVTDRCNTTNNPSSSAYKTDAIGKVCNIGFGN